MKRRNFLKSVVGAGILAGTADIKASTKTKQKASKAVLKLSSQEWLIPGKNFEEKLAKLEKWGAVGIELSGNGLAGRVPELKAVLKNSPIKISAICAGFSGVPMSHDPQIRAQAVTSIKDILSAAGQLESTGLIIVPAFNGQTQLNNLEGRKTMLELLPELGEHAHKNGTRILLEPLNRREAFFLRQLADAAAICRDVNHPGIAMMGDFYHMHIEETSDMGAFISAGDYLHHVHLASRSLNRTLPGVDKTSYVDGFRGLKMIGFRDYCSLECGVKGNADVEIPKSFKYLRNQWEQATI